MMATLFLWLLAANGAGGVLTDLLLRTDRGRHGRLNAQPLHNWRHTEAAVRRRAHPRHAGRRRHAGRELAHAG